MELPGRQVPGTTEFQQCEGEAMSGWRMESGSRGRGHGLPAAAAEAAAAEAAASAEGGAAAETSGTLLCGFGGH